MVVCSAESGIYKWWYVALKADFKWCCVVLKADFKWWYVV